MTTLNLDENKAQYQIRSYKPGCIRINEKIFMHSVIISPNQLIEDWQPQSIEELSAAKLQIVLELKPDILLIGTGIAHVLLPIEIYGELINHRIGVEVMDTGAACRTYNALSSENRNVAAALLVK